MTRNYTIPPQHSHSDFLDTFLFYIYSLFNVVTGGINVSKKIKIKQYLPGSKFKSSIKIPEASPSRKLSNIFWENLPWEKIKNDLGVINILDLGCGKGIYCDILFQISGLKINSYTGLDLNKSDKWNDIKQKYKNVNFSTYDGEHLLEKIPKNVNFIISQSVLEHTENDIKLFRDIKIFVNKNNVKLLQIHLVPSLSGIYVFGKHGYRQYSLRTISMIADVFDSKSYITVYKLGSFYSNFLHFIYVSLPKLLFIGDQRKNKLLNYYKNSDRIVYKDLQNPLPFAPAFYAIEIKTNYEDSDI